jgi:plasmid stabilization system protein ParE
VPVTLDPAQTPRTGLSAEETLRRIEHCSSWLVLKNVERDPAYAALLEHCLADVRRMAPEAGASMQSRLRDAVKQLVFRGWTRAARAFA